MLDGLLGRSNFKTKCKSALTRTMTRLEIIKKKRSAILKFLKEDVADLLKSNLDRNAYGRAEGLYMELNQSSCYDYVEECCKCISDSLKDMHIQSECPEECIVFAASLIYAAARFADLPELRDLRAQFSEKYGETLELFVSKEFVEKLKFRPPTKEMKIRLMQDIAQEFSIPWDPKPLEQQLKDLTHSPMQNFCRSRSGMFPGKEITEGIRLLHSQSSRENISCKSKEQHNRQEPKTPLFSSRNHTEDNGSRTPFINGSTTKDEDSCRKGENHQNSGNIFGIKWRPKSIKIKSFVKQSQNSGPEPETEVKEPLSAKARGEMRYGLRRGGSEKERTMNTGFLMNYSKMESSQMTSLSANSNGLPMSQDLPLPPGRRRYLFPDSQRASLFKEANQIIINL